MPVLLGLITVELSGLLVYLLTQELPSLLNPVPVQYRAIAKAAPSPQ